MKFCKRETFLYWFVHFVVWAIVALPTVFFLLRISHPPHPSMLPSTHNNTYDTGNRALLDQSCSNFTKEGCSSSDNENSSNSRPNQNDDISMIWTAASTIRENFECRKRLKLIICHQKYFSCSLEKNITSQEAIALQTYVVNQTHVFCKSCSKYPHTINNISLARQRPKWLKDLPCLSFAEFFSVRNKTSVTNATTCSPPLVKDQNDKCRIPCDWSLMSSGLRNAYYAIMVVNMWAALIATVITLATLASFPKMREFPHIVRFYILIYSALYATATLLPLRIGLAKVYCGKEKYWREEGQSTKLAVMEGATTHYFFLGFCFWSLCYVINAYSVIIKQAHQIFDHKHKYHLIEFLVSAALPALLVGINIAAKNPGYKSLFLDRMTSVFSSPTLEHLTFTLPVQVSIGLAVSLLWSIIRFVRKVRKSNTTFQAVRPDEDIRGFINAERQFIKLAVLFIITVAVVLCSEVVIMYRNEEYVHSVEKYFECLQTSTKCQKPRMQIFFLSSVKICGPGIYCLINFFLLFFNKDTRDVWKKWFYTCYNTLLCKCRTRTDGKYLQNAGGLQTEQGMRARSSTLDSRASLYSPHKLSTHTITTLPSKFASLQGRQKDP